MTAEGQISIYAVSSALTYSVYSFLLISLSAFTLMQIPLDQMVPKKADECHRIKEEKE